MNDWLSSKQEGLSFSKFLRTQWFSLFLFTAMTFVAALEATSVAPSISILLFAAWVSGWALSSAIWGALLALHKRALIEIFQNLTELAEKLKARQQETNK